ncbi:syntaxin-4-like [Solea solea]|uniref:syntaxin-4-like n=1 Tax=Solea solea TaxID=90069 RepID=UPI00272A6BBE|nr:syntaxin-4-like [Solea solea]
MRDRIKELRKYIEASDQDDDDEEETRALITKPRNSSTKEEKESEAFLKKAHEIHEEIQSLKKMVLDLENKQKTVLSMALPVEGRKKELQFFAGEIKTMASQIQRKLRNIEPKKGVKEGKYIPINVRIQRTQHSICSKMFLELVGYFYTVQSRYRDCNKERIQRQLNITGVNVSDEELDAMLESGKMDVQIFSSCATTKQDLDEIESQHDEILKLEQSIETLHDMFQYLTIEVVAQGEMVNRIQNNIDQSSVNVEKAKDNTGKAVTYRQKACKKKIWIAIFLAIVVVTLVILLSTLLST